MGEDKNIEKIIEKKVQERLEKERENIRKKAEKNAKREAKKEIRKELKQDFVEDVSKETGEKNMSRRQFLKKAGLGAAGFGALSLSPAAANLKLTKNGIFGSGGLNQEIKDLETLNTGSINTDNVTVNNRGSRAHLSSQQSIPSTSITQINFDTTTFDNQGGWDLTNNKYVTQTSGIFLISLKVHVEQNTASSGTNIQARVNIGGSLESWAVNQFADSDAQSVIVTDVFEFSSGTDIVFNTYHDDSDSITIDSGKIETTASVVRIA